MRVGLVLVSILALLTCGLAGCLQLGGEALTDQALSPVSLPIYEGLVVKGLTIETDDGVVLNATAFLPEAPEGERLPVIADIGPYYGNLAGKTSELSGFDKRLADYFVPRGYVVVRASVRGTGVSEGCFDLGGAREQQDVKRIVDFLGTQPWSNGNVAVIGKSYDGTTPWQAAISQPEHLRTIVPISGITDMYRYMFYEGAAYTLGPAFNTYYSLLVDWDTWPLGPLDGGPAVYPDHVRQNVARTCFDTVPQAVKGIETYFTGDHGDPFWAERDYEAQLDKIKVPVFVVHGLQDWNVKPDNQVPIFNKLTGPKKMWLGQWAHDYPDVNRYNRDWDRQDWNETLLQWFDFHLKNRGPAPAYDVEVQDSAGAWQKYAQWPLAAAKPGVDDASAQVEDMTLFLAGEGRLASAPAGGPDVVLPGGPGGQAPFERRYASEALTRNVTVTGMPHLTLHLSSNLPTGYVAVTLYDVTPDNEWKAFDWAFLNLRHRETREHGKDVTPGEVMALPLKFYPTHTVVAEGHRVGVGIRAQDEGWLFVPHGTPMYEVHHDAQSPSLLAFTVLKGGADAFPIERAGNTARAPSWSPVVAGALAN